jgi:rRNA maturation endonuclease Nob1
VDSLQKRVDERDRANNDPKVLERNKRERVPRRVCRACWKVFVPHPFAPNLTACLYCGGNLDDVTL